MTQDRASHSKGQKNAAANPNIKGSYYDLLGINPTATAQEVRQAYREQSKRFHPDTTQLPPPEAKQKFHSLNEAYGILNNPAQRLQYDQKNGFSQFSGGQTPSELSSPRVAVRSATDKSSAYLDPTDRPLSAGEIFALVILGFTFFICLLLAIVLSFTQGGLHLGFHPLLTGEKFVQAERFAPRTPVENSEKVPDQDSRPNSLADSVKTSDKPELELDPNPTPIWPASEEFDLLSKLPKFSFPWLMTPDSANLSTVQTDLQQPLDVEVKSPVPEALKSQVQVSEVLELEMESTESHSSESPGSPD